MSSLVVVTLKIDLLFHPLPSEPKLLVVEGSLEQSQKLSPEQSTRDANRQKESVPTSRPPFAVEAQTAAREMDLEAVSGR